MFNLNTLPYFDDFVGEKKFQRILFKPGYAVQARELTQLQTILQAQIERFGDNVFKQGSVITGCAESHNFNVPAVKVNDGFVGNLSDYIGSTVTAPNGVSALVKAVGVGSQSQAPNLNTLYVQYTSNDIATGIISTFQDGDVLSVNNSSTFVVATNGITAGSLFELSDGIVYANGFFVIHSNQIILIDPYSTTPTQNVGFVLQETIVTSDDDTSLLDPASGTFNFAAPGADRYQLSTVLTSYAPTDAKPDGFFLLFEIENGVIKRRYDKTQYAELGIELAQRTYDEAGNYTVNAFPLFISEHLNNGLSVENNHGKYLQSAGGDPSKLVVGVEPGRAYVHGFEQELFATENLVIDKAIDTRIVQNEFITTAYGNYLIVKEVTGPWATNLGETVELHNVPIGAVTAGTYSNHAAPSGGSKVGTAKFRTIELLSGTPGAAATQYALYLYDIVMTSGNFSAVESVYLADAVHSYADVVSISPAALNDTKYISLLFPLTHNNAKDLADTAFTSTKQFTGVVVANDGSFSIATTGTDTWAFSSISDPIAHTNIIVVAETDFAGASSAIKKGRIIDFKTTGNVVTRASDTGLNFALATTTSGSPTVTIIVNIRNVSTYNTKTLLHDRFVKIETGTNIGGMAGPYLLGVHDIFSLDNVWVNTASGHVAAPATLAALLADATWEDKTTDFVLQSGATDGTYGLDSISSALTHSNKSIIVKFSYLQHGSVGGYFITQSFPLPAENVAPTADQIAWYQIPKYTTSAGVTYNLRDTIDFRPTLVCSAGAGSAITPLAADSAINPLITTAYAGGFTTPTPDGTFIADIEYHLSRIDRITLDGEGTFLAVRGTAADTPVAPREPDNAMTLGFVNVPAYPSLSPYFARIVNREEYATSVQVVDNRRFTMKDISNLESRVDRLEYRESLSSLEQSAADLEILTSEGVNRHKNGILVDAFIGHNVGNVYDPAYQCSIADGELRPFFNLDNVEFSLDPTSTNVVQSAVDASGRTDTIIVVQQLVGALDYEEGTIILENVGGSGTLKHSAKLASNDTYKWVRLYLEQVTGTFAENNTINSGSGTITYSGVTGSTKTVDGKTFNVTLQPMLVITPLVGVLITLPYSHVVYTENPYASQVRNCASDILFTYEGDVVLTPNVDGWMDTTVFSEVQINTNNLFDNWKTLSTAWGTQWDDWNTLWKGVIKPIDISVDNTLLATALTTEQRQIRDGISLSSKLDVVGNVIPFVRSSVVKFEAKRLKPNTKLHAFFDGVDVTTYCKNNADSTYGTNPLKSDGYGNIVGQFRIPSETFTVGTKLFVLTDNETDPQSLDMTVTASATFVVSGSESFEQRTIISTQKPEVTFNRQRQTQNIVVNRQVTTSDNVDTSDPLTQTFFVSNSENGILLTKMVVYFQARSGVNGITLQLREVVNGYPSDTILPFSSVTLQPKDVNVSNDGTAGSEFKFASPVYLKNNTEYCFVLIPTGNDNSYQVWESVVGQPKIGTTEIIDKQPNAGTLFAVGNNRVWTEFINEDIKFSAYAAQFTPNTVEGALILSNKAIDYLTLTPNSSSVVLNPGDVLTGGAGGVGVIKYFNKTTSEAQVSITSGSFSASDTFTRTGDSATGTVVRNKRLINAISPTLSHLAFNNATIDWTYQMYASDTTPFSGYDSLEIEGTTELTTENAVFSHSAYPVTFQIQGVLSTTNSNISPVVDLSKVSCVVVANSINTDATQFHSGLNENLPASGTALSKYISRTVVLNDGEDSEDLRVYLSAFLPSGSEVQVYGKFLNVADHQPFANRPWQLLNQNIIQSSSTFNEYFYSTASGVVGYNVGGIPYVGYRTFAVKIVLLSPSTTTVPIVRDLRAIALLQ